jgi:probable HAF family extracellular repeat protein
MTTNTAYRYRLGEPSLQLLGIQPGYTSSQAKGISGDGETVVGMSFAGQTDEFAQAFRWTSTTGLVGLGYLQPGQGYSEAAAISRDGSAIVGYVTQTTGFNQAFVWREGTGMVGLPGFLATNSGRAAGINYDGSIVVGTVSTGGNLTAASMWVNGSLTLLGVPTGFNRSRAFGVSNDGSVVVGQLDGHGQTAAIWTPGRGMEPLSTYLSFHGIQVPSGINLLTATAVSADGLTIAGYSGPPGQVRDGFVVHIPAPASVLGLPVLLLAKFRRRN